jgi:hypothetical protein
VKRRLAVECAQVKISIVLDEEFHLQMSAFESRGLGLHTHTQADKRCWRQSGPHQMPLYKLLRA